jgi:predicted transcriptional regulator
MTTLSDSEFREAFKPLYIPAHYEQADTIENKVAYALAQLGEGTVSNVMDHLESLQPGFWADQLTPVKHVLTDLYDKGLLSGRDEHGHMYYNLAKVTEANNGAVNPELLAPGLD